MSYKCPTCGNTDVMKCRFTGEEIVDGYITWYCGHYRKAKEAVK